jgi:kynurenine formamidase
MNNKNCTEMWGSPQWDCPVDLSWPLNFDGPNPRAFHIPAPTRTPIRMGGFVGSVAEGGSCNVYALSLHPHGQGTHTECVGHIAREPYFLNDCLQKFWFRALLCRVVPREENGDQIIRRIDLKRIWDAMLMQSDAGNGLRTTDCGIEALIVCTGFRGSDESTGICPDFSASNPPYFEAAALELVREMGVLHLLTDLPSVDREDDGGHLAAHHAFWNYPESPRVEATITEMIRLPSNLPDGFYHLNLMIAPLQSDASPSKPILYPRTSRQSGV